jgi:gliding motility-associated-like protein
VNTSFTGTGIVSGTTGSFPRYFVNYNNFTYFLANQLTSGQTVLYRTTGASASITPIKVLFLNAHAFSSHVSFGGMVKAGNYLYFTAQGNSPIANQAYNIELWQSDGSNAGTVPTVEINNNTPNSTTTPVVNGGSFPQNLTPATINGTDYLFFTADDNYYQRTGVTYPFGVNPIVLDSLGNRELYVRLANDAATVASTRIEINPLTTSVFGSPCTSGSCTITSKAGSRPVHLTPYNNKLFFIATSNGDTGTLPSSGDKLYYTDGTLGGTVAVALPGASTRIDRNFKMVVSNGILYFAAFTPTTGRELWKYDAATATASMVKNFNGASSGLVVSNPAFAGTTPMTFEAVDVNGTLFFAARHDATDDPINNPLYDDGLGPSASGVELYQSDGTFAGTRRVANIGAGATSSFPRKMANVNGVLYFFISNASNQPEIWQHIPVNTCDGTFVKTKAYFDATTTPAYTPTSSSSISLTETNFGLITPVGNDFYFQATDLLKANNQPEPWYAEACATSNVVYGTVCKTPTVTTASPAITFVKTSLQSCAPAVTTPTNLCPLGNCFCSASLGGAIDGNTGIVNLNHPNATTGVHKICYHYRDATTTCMIPVCADLNIQGASVATNVVELVAGDGTFGNTNGGDATLSNFKFSDGGVALESSENGNLGVAFSPDGTRMYIADEFNHQIRVMDMTANPNVLIASIGIGFEGYNDNANSALAAFNRPTGIAVDQTGIIYVADKRNHRIRKINPNPPYAVTTIAGSATLGLVDNVNPLLARFHEPSDIVIDNNGNLYIADKNNHAIRKITPSLQVSTLAGGSGAGLVNGTGSVAKFTSPSGIDLDLNGDILVADRVNHVIRRVTQGGVVTTLAGTGVAGFADGGVGEAQFNQPYEVTVTSTGKIYVADGGNHRIREIEGANVSTYAGDGAEGYINGSALSARFKTPVGIADDPSAKVYVTDRFNNRIRRIRLNSDGGDISGSTAICMSDPTPRNLTAINYLGFPATSIITRWESSIDNGTTWVSVGNSGSATYTYSNLTVTTLFRVIFAESACGTVRSNIATVQVIVPPTPVLVSAPAICLGQSATITVSGGSAGEYIWEDVTNAINPIPAQNNATYTFTPTTSGVKTYTVRIKKGACEGAKLTVNLTVYPLPTPAITGNATACTGIAQTFTTTNTVGNTYEWTVDGMIQTSSTTNTLIYTWNTGTAGTVNVKERTPAPANCEGTSVVFNVTINASPAVQVIAPASPAGDAICHNVPQNYSITTTNSVSWTVDDPITTNNAKGTFSPTNTPNTTFTGINTGTTPITAILYCTETGGNGCKRIHSRTITINPLPTIKTITGNALVCATGTNAYNYTPESGNTSIWTATNASGDASGTVQGSATGTSVSYTWAGSGTINLCVTETNPTTGCTRQHCRVITVNPLPTAQTISGSNSVCVNTSQTYSITPVAGNQYNFNLTLGSGTVTSGAGNSFTTTFTAIGAARICVTETNLATTCQVVYCLDINVNPFPVSQTITGNVNVCVGSTHTYAVTNTGNTFDWNLPSGGTHTPDNANTTSVTWTTVGTHTLSVEESNGASCKTTNNLTVTVHALPAAPTVAPTTSTCAGSVVTYTATGGTGTFTWEITGGTPATATGNSVAVTWGSAGTGILKVRETSLAPASCLGAETTQNITINPNPTTPTVSPTANVCVNSNPTYNIVSPSGGSTYAWIVTRPNGTILTGTGTSLAVDWQSTAGVGKIEIVETDANGCKSPAIPLATPQNITVIALPIAPVITPTTAVCSGSNPTYNITSPNVGSTYDWTVTKPDGTIQTGTGTSLPITWGTVAGTGTIVITETNATGCIGTPLNQNITINATPGLPTISPTATSVCLGATVTYTATGGSGNFEWEITNNGVTTNHTGASSPPITWAGTVGEVKVREVTPAPSNCQGDYRVQPITVNPLPTKQAITGNTSVCAGSSQTYTLASTNPTSTYQWKLNGNNITLPHTWTTGGTITVEETDINGCKQTHDNGLTPFVVTVIPLPNPVITGANTNICANSTQTYTVATPNLTNTYEWTITGGEILPVGTGQTKTGVGLSGIQVTWGSGLAGTVIVREITPAPANCERTTAVYNVALTPAPTAQTITGTTVVGVIANVCPNSTHSYSVANNATNLFTWTVTGGLIQPENVATKSGVGLQNISIKWDTGASGSIKLVETTPAPSNCSSNESNVAVIINPAPVPQTITGNNAVCQGSTHTYTVANNPTNFFNWVPTGGVIQGASSGVGLQSVTITWNNDATTGKIDVTETTPANCGSAVPSSLNVTVNPTPTITSISPTANVCGGETVTYTFTGTNLAGATPTWIPLTNGVKQSETNNSITIKWNDVTTNVVETLRVKTATATGCESAEFTQTININPLPADQIITGVSPVCVNTTETYSVPSKAGRTYAWCVTPATLTSTACGTGNTANIAWIQTGSATLTFEETITATGCKKVHTKTILINTTPPAITINDIIGNTTVCAGGQSMFSINNPNNYAVKWFIVGGTSPDDTANPVTVDWGANPVSIAVRFSAGSCQSTSPDKPVNGVTAPTVSFTPNTTSVCLGGTTTHTAPPIPTGHTYEWIANGGTIIGAANTNTVQVRWNTNNGTEYVRLKITIDGTNCSGISPLPSSPADLGFVTVNPLPAPVITGDNEVCRGETVIYQVPTVTDNTYKWTIDNGTTTGATIVGADDQPQVSIKWGTDGTAKVKLVQKITATGCEKEATDFNVTIVPDPAIPTSPNRFVCNPPKIIDLSATSAGAISYAWYDSPTSTTPIATTPIFSPNITADVSYWVRAINAQGCEGDSTEVKITVNPASTNLVITPTLVNADSCVATGDSPSGRITLALQGSNAPYSFVWTKVGVPSFSATTQNLTELTRGDYQVVITDAGGCTTTSPVYTINEILKTLQNPEIVYENRVLADDEEITVAQGASVSFKAQAVDAQKYEWRNGAATVVGTNQTLTPPTNEIGTVTYTVTITNSRNCSALRKVRLKVVQMSVYVPNVFSPNNDNNNDKLQIFGNGIKSVNFKVYNRLGQVVYETDKWVEGTNTDKALGWDGIYNNKLQESGNYTWLLSVTYINDTADKKTGNVYLKH